MFGNTRLTVFVTSIRSKAFLSIHYTLIYSQNHIIYKDTFISDIFLGGGVLVGKLFCSFINPLISLYKQLL